MEHKACQTIFDSTNVLGQNKTRVNDFEAKLLQYMKDNVALVNIFIKEPFSVKIKQEIKVPM